MILCLNHRHEGVKYRCEIFPKYFTGIISHRIAEMIAWIQGNIPVMCSCIIRLSKIDGCQPPLPWNIESIHHSRVLLLYHTTQPLAPVNSSIVPVQCQQPLATSNFTMGTTGFVMSLSGWKGVWGLVGEAEWVLEMGGLLTYSDFWVVLGFGNIFPSSGTNPSCSVHPFWDAVGGTTKGETLPLYWVLESK